MQAYANNCAVSNLTCDELGNYYFTDNNGICLPLDPSTGYCYYVSDGYFYYVSEFDENGCFIFPENNVSESYDNDEINYLRQQNEEQQQIIQKLERENEELRQQMENSNKLVEKSLGTIQGKNYEIGDLRKQLDESADSLKASNFVKDSEIDRLSTLINQLEAEKRKLKIKSACGQLRLGLLQKSHSKLQESHDNLRSKYSQSKELADKHDESSEYRYLLNTTLGLYADGAVWPIPQAQMSSFFESKEYAFVPQVVEKKPNLGLGVKDMGMRQTVRVLFSNLVHAIMSYYGELTERCHREAIITPNNCHVLNKILTVFYSKYCVLAQERELPVNEVYSYQQFVAQFNVYRFEQHFDYFNKSSSSDDSNNHI